MSDYLLSGKIIPESLTYWPDIGGVVLIMFGRKEKNHSPALTIRPPAVHHQQPIE
jgi:hypothetical protein